VSGHSAERDAGRRRYIDADIVEAFCEGVTRGGWDVPEVVQGLLRLLGDYATTVLPPAESPTATTEAER
jgi:hypothetical protein